MTGKNKNVKNQKKIMRRYYFPLWLAVFLLAPSIWVHRLFMFQTPPPGSNLPGPPLFVAFGGIVYFGEIWGQLVRADFMDAAIIFVFLVLPILIYTFILSLGIYYFGRFILHKSRKKDEANIITNS